MHRDARSRRTDTPTLRQVRFGVGLLIAASVLAALPATSYGQLAQPPFQAHTDYDVPSNPWPVLLVDLNQDGKLDLVSGNEGTNSISVLLGLTHGSFGARTDHQVGLAPRGMAVGDLNGDPFPDLAVANYLGNSVTILLGNGAGGFLSAQTHPTGTGAYSVAIGNVDLQGGNDVVVANAASNNVSVLFGDGSGVFGSKQDFAIGLWPVVVDLRDLNGDARLDLISANYVGNNISIAFGEQGSIFGPVGTIPVGPGPWGMVVADLNGDALPDIATANSLNATVSVVKNAGNSVLQAAVHYSSGASTPAALAAGDLNRDGMVDLGVAHMGTNSMGILRGIGDGTFTTPFMITVGAVQHGIAIADINADTHPDFAVTLPVPDRVAVFRNGVFLPLELTTTPNPSALGQTVSIQASIPASTASGRVDLFVNDQPAGSSLMINGTASFVYSSFTLGENEIVAMYTGDVTHPPDAATTYHYVKTESSVSLSSAPNPSEIHQPVELTATLSPASATGVVRFYNGNTLLGESTIDAGVAVMQRDSLNVGVRSLRAVYDGDDELYSSTDTLTHVVNKAYPRITAVRDVPADQGGSVFLTWSFSIDKPGLTYITGYRVWRRVPALEAMTSRKVETFHVRGPDGALQATYWEALADLPAAQLTTYGYRAATTRDSMPGSNPWTAYFVQALTPRTFDYYNSEPDSGYSVDNLAPAQPQTFVGVYGPEGVRLHWTKNGEADLAGYRLHRGTTEQFVPGDQNLVSAQPDTGYFDEGAPFAAHYKLAAVDRHGNRSPYALVAPDLPTQTGASLLSVSVTSGRVSLVWTAAGGRDVSIYRRTPDEGWRQLDTRTPDGEGRVRYDDAGVAPGRYGYRIGIQRGDGETFAGEVWVDVPRFELALSVTPNPVRAMPIRVDFTLPTDGPASLTLFDIGGRRIAAADVGAMGAGAHTVDLAPRGNLEPGVYLLRLQRAGESRMKRIVVTR